MKTCTKCKTEKALDAFEKNHHKSGRCLECKKADTKKRYQNNLEKERERSRRKRISNPDYYKEYYQEHKEKWRVYRQNWKEAHPEQAAQAISEWKKANREKVATYTRNRRAKVAGISGEHVTPEQIEELYGESDGVCPACSKNTKLTVDHIVPIARGGSNSIDNLQLICGRCNSSKGTKIVDWRQ